MWRKSEKEHMAAGRDKQNGQKWMRTDSHASGGEQVTAACSNRRETHVHTHIQHTRPTGTPLGTHHLRWGCRC